jgi:hypothetical protein
MEGRPLGKSGGMAGGGMGSHYEAALMDATAALELDPTHIKALYRRTQSPGDH